MCQLMIENDPMTTIQARVPPSGRFLYGRLESGVVDSSRKSSWGGALDASSVRA